MIINKSTMCFNYDKMGKICGFNIAIVSDALVDNILC